MSCQSYFSSRFFHFIFLVLKASGRDDERYQLKRRDSFKRFSFVPLIAISSRGKFDEQLLFSLFLASSCCCWLFLFLILFFRSFVDYFSQTQLCLLCFTLFSLLLCLKNIFFLCGKVATDKAHYFRNSIRKFTI